MDWLIVGLILGGLVYYQHLTGKIAELRSQTSALKDFAKRTQRGAQGIVERGERDATTLRRNIESTNQEAIRVLYFVNNGRPSPN